MTTVDKPWHSGPLVSWDLETTGVDVETERIVTASRWAINPAARSTEVRDWLVDPGVEIPAEAAAIHKVTTEKARADGRPAKQAVAEIATDLLRLVGDGAALVVYNARYDVTLLHRELVRYGHADLAARWATFAVTGPVVDPFVLDKHVDKYRKGSRKLIHVAEHYGVELSEEDAHGSSADALASARIAWHIANRNPNLAAMTLPELHELQVKAAATQARGLAAYFDKKGQTHDVREEWPLVPAA